MTPVSEGGAHVAILHSPFKLERYPTSTELFMG
jgi:hypothetical protein